MVDKLRRGASLLCLLLLLALLAPSAWSHALGVDWAELAEGPDETYVLRVKIPQALGHLITTPELPEHCDLEDPRGQRGIAEIRFQFSCEQPLSAGDVLALPWRRTGVMLTVAWADGNRVQRIVANEGRAITVDLASFQAGSGSLADAARRYTTLGTEHILLGIDHLLFVLGLLLLVHGGWMLVKTITAFTVAHSITLGLATLGYVQAPTRPVEAAIALSIVFVAAEIAHARHGRIGLAARRPWVVAFAFGLLHGFGFAGALSEIGLPPSEIPIALLFFNVGVELGQLVFVGVALTLTWMLRRLPVKWPSWVEAIPAYAIGTMAMYWFFDRASWLLPT